MEKAIRWEEKIKPEETIRPGKTIQKKEIIRVGFAGNPNCGKTTLFNGLTGANLKIANWPGVTVERVEGEMQWQGRHLQMIDLPGIYSLTSYSIEEIVTRTCLNSDEVDVIVNVADATSLERHLYLTLQLLQLKKPVVLALNMMDLAEQKGLKIDRNRLSAMLNGIPVIPVSARKRQGFSALLNAVAAQNDRQQEKECRTPELSQKPPETDKNQQEKEEAAYRYIEEIIRQCLRGGQKTSSFTDRADCLLLHPLLGIPCFLCIMAVIFFLTFTLGDFLKSYFEMGLECCSSAVSALLARLAVAPWLVSLIVDGILAGVGAVLSFLPNIAILFFCLAMLEDSGYMARAAYVMNGVMGKAGLSGKAFLPLLLGFGCTVPAVMAARTLENQRDRKKTIFMTPFMSCPARLPVYILFAGMFFPGHAMAAVYALYLLGVLAAVGAAFALEALWPAKAQSQPGLLLELPEYKRPGLSTVLVSVREKTKDYLTRAGTTIFAASVILWLLLHYNQNGMAADVGESFGARLGMLLVPVLKPAGLGLWQIAVALIGGLSAKEVVVSSCSVLFGVAGLNSAQGMARLQRALSAQGFTAANAAAMLVFCLLYTPCAAAVAAIRRETGSNRWTAAVMGFQLALAWVCAAVVYHAGRLLGL